MWNKRNKRERERERSLGTRSGEDREYLKKVLPRGGGGGYGYMDAPKNQMKHLPNIFIIFIK